MYSEREGSPMIADFYTDFGKRTLAAIARWRHSCFYPCHFQTNGYCRGMQKDCSLERLIRVRNTAHIKYERCHIKAGGTDT